MARCGPSLGPLWAMGMARCGPSLGPLWAVLFYSIRDKQYIVSTCMLAARTILVRSAPTDPALTLQQGEMPLHRRCTHPRRFSQSAQRRLETVRDHPGLDVRPVAIVSARCRAGGGRSLRRIARSYARRPPDGPFVLKSSFSNTRHPAAGRDGVAARHAAPGGLCVRGGLRRGVRPGDSSDQQAGADTVAVDGGTLKPLLKLTSRGGQPEPVGTRKRRVFGGTAHGTRTAHRTPSTVMHVASSTVASVSSCPANARSFAASARACTASRQACSKPMIGREPDRCSS